MTDYISALGKAIKVAHGCESIHLRGLSARDAFGTDTAWVGMVELFLLGRHLKANIAYAWGVEAAGAWQITTALERPHARPARPGVRPR